MEKHNLPILDRLLHKSDYFFSTESNIMLKDKILTYFDGEIWKIIPLSIMLTYPIIYDVFHNDDTITPISIVLCPFTLSSCVFEGIFTISEYIQNSCLVITSNNISISVAMNNSIKIKKWETQIKIFRNAMSDNPDCQFIKLKNKFDKLIIDETYYNDTYLLFKPIESFSPYKIHPKTLVHVIHYKSLKSGLDKYTIVIGHDSSNLQASGYNLKNSKIYKYIDSMHFKLKEKSGFIIPILSFASGIYPNPKFIKL